MFAKYLLLNFLISGIVSDFFITNDGVCTCDYNANVCDIGCCCDTSCSALQIQSFTCSNTQISPLSYGCLPSEVLFGNNTSYKINNDGSQMCIYSDNYTLRNFYYAPNLTNFKSTFTSISSSPISYSSFSALSVLNYTTYSYGSPIYTFQFNGATPSVGYLSVAQPSASDGSCIFGLPIQYLQNQAVTCSYTTDCSNLPGVDLYLTNTLLVASFPSAMLAYYSYDISLNNTGNLTSSGNFITPNVVCNLGPCASLVKSGCNNIVTGANMTISGESGITSVNINLQIANVIGQFTHTSNVVFTKTGFNPENSQYSGNPGYLTGKPLRAIYNNNLLKDWLIPAGDDCVTGSRTKINFGYNMEIDCSFAVVNLASVNSSLTSSLPSYIGPFGNSAASDSDQVPVISSSENSNSSSALKKQFIYVVYARNGTLTLPQNKVIGVKVTNVYSDIPQGVNNSWVSISVSFIDASQTVFDVNAAVIRARSGRSVRDFLYLLYVENHSISAINFNKIYILLCLSFWLAKSFQI